VRQREQRRINSSMATIIEFPNSNTDPAFVQSEKQRLENVKRYQVDLCLNTSIDLTYMILEEVTSRGIDLDPEELDQHLLMVAESIKSMMLKACGVRHPLQKVTESIVNREDGAAFATQWRYDRDGVIID